MSWGCPDGHGAPTAPRGSHSGHKPHALLRDFLCRLCCCVPDLCPGEERDQTRAGEGRGGDGQCQCSALRCRALAHPREEGQQQICYESGLITTSSFPPGWNKWTRKLYSTFHSETITEQRKRKQNIAFVTALFISGLFFFFFSIESCTWSETIFKLI